jgi:hypothetical protein
MTTAVEPNETNFKMRSEWLAAGATEQEAAEKCKWQRYYSTAIHEAGHGVMHCRISTDVINGANGDTRTAEDFPLKSLEIFDEGGGIARGVIYHIAIVAGHFAELRWGWGDRKVPAFVAAIRRSAQFGGGGDFAILVKRAAESRHYCLEEHYDNSKPRVKKADRVAARKIWNKNMRRLSALAKRDPSFGQQVKAVANALVEKRKLSGDEVKAIMQSV